MIEVKVYDDSGLLLPANRIKVEYLDVATEAYDEGVLFRQLRDQLRFHLIVERWVVFEDCIGRIK